MLAVGHEPTDERESFEVALFRGQQRISNKVRDDPLDELVELARLPLQRLVAAVRPDASAPERRRPATRGAPRRDLRFG